MPDMKLAILDDYQRVALKMADWSHVGERCRIDVIDRPLRTVKEAIQTLRPYDIICMLRERTAAPRELIEGLPNLKLLAITGPKHRTLDLQAATEHGVIVCNSPVPAADAIRYPGARDRLDVGLGTPHPPGRETATRGPLADGRRHAGLWPYAGDCRAWWHRKQRCPDGSGSQHAGDRMEPEPDQRSRSKGRSAACRKRRAFLAIRHHQSAFGFG